MNDRKKEKVQTNYSSGMNHWNIDHQENGCNNTKSITFSPNMRKNCYKCFYS